MANDITPGSTNIAPSGRTMKIDASLEFNVGSPTPTANRTPLVQFIAENVAFEQLIDFSVDVPASIDNQNLWEAPSDILRARAVIVQCEYGGGGIVINPVGADVPFPISADASAGNGFFLYINPSGVGLTVTVGDTGPGIQKINVSTEVESRFKVYVFV